MGECKGRALNREGGAFCSDSATINAHAHTPTSSRTRIHSHTFTRIRQFRLSDTYRHTQTFKISVYLNVSHWKMFAHTHTVHTVMHMQKILTCCFPVGYVWQSISWLCLFVCACVYKCCWLKVEKAGWFCRLIIMLINYLANRCYIVLVALRLPVVWMRWRVW